MSSTRKEEEKQVKQLLYIGTYTEDILFGTGQLFHGQGKGISICEFEDGRITEISKVAVRNPSFVCKYPGKGKLYSVNEMKEYRDKFGGGVTEISCNEDYSMRIVRDDNTDGTDPCHIEISPDQTFLAVSNFASGSLTVLYLDAQGRMTGEKALFQHEGSSVHPKRQKGPHAHSALFVPGEKRFYVPDLGTDTLYAYTWTGGKVERDPQRDVSVEKGSGPRYGEFDKAGNNFYLINEIASQVKHFVCENGMLEARETVSTLPEDFTGDNICSDLHLSVDGKYLYASNRGHDSLAVFAVGTDGSLSLCSRIPCGGKTPRNFCVEPTGKYVLVGNQDSDNITVFSVLEGGRLEEVSKTDWGSPVCIRFWK